MSSSSLSEPPPHESALFSLVPVSQDARAAVSLPANSALRTQFNDGTLVLTLDLTSKVENNRVLATIGRSDADIVLPRLGGPSIQCYFELHPHYNGYIMLHDVSRWRTTQVSGDGVLSFQPGRPRRIVVQQGKNMAIGMGRRCDLYKFQVVMHVDVDDIAYRLSSLGLQPDWLSASSESRFTSKSSSPSVEPRVILTRKRDERIRYSTTQYIGYGSFGTVEKCVDVDSGRLMAVKTIPVAYCRSAYLDREVAILSTVSHPNIVEFLGSQEGPSQKIEIFMALNDGSIDDLCSWQPRPLGLAKNVLIQMLRALAYLESMSLIHRDVKPDNILYSYQYDGSLQFYLADFGLANWVDDSFTRCGTGLFWAPEISSGLEYTAKVDVWSLFITYLWLANAGGFRVSTRHIKECRLIWAEVQHVCNMKRVSQTVSTIRNMGAEDPDKRLSASEALELLESE